VTLVRARVELQNVTWQILPGTQIAHVRVVAFSQGVSEDLRAALDQIPIASQRGLILDLRNDPGGLLDEAVATASLFLQGGDVLQVRDAQGQTQVVPVASDAPTYGLPMVVLVNQGTASAAEIVAGALQDPGRATLVGETTFGTGTVLQEFPLADGSRLLLATQEWLTPKGRVIWHQGLAPDIAVALSADSEPLFPGATRDLSIEQVQSGDPQLGRAIELLNADRQAKWIPLAPLAQLRGGAE
jgi:carboxyl-terminal processing protease